MRLLPLLLAWLLMAPGLPAAPGDGKKIEVQFAAQAVPRDLDLVMATPEAQSEAFFLPLNNLTAPLEAPARTFQLKVDGAETVVATVKLPDTGNAFIILLVPGEKSGFEPVIIPARDAAFRPGDYYCHNTSGKPILGKVGTTRFALAPRKGQVVRPDGAREGRFYDVTLGVREGEESRVISTSRWPVGKQMRTYVFFFDNPKRKDVDFRAIDEFVPPVPKPQEQ